MISIKRVVRLVMDQGILEPQHYIQDIQVSLVPYVIRGLAGHYLY